MKGVLEAALGKDNVAIAEPIPASEDFSYFVEQGIPGFYFDFGERTRRSLRRPRLPGRRCRRIIPRCSRRMWIRRCIPGLKRKWWC